MKKIIILLLCIVCISTAIFAQHTTQPNLRHVVLFSFKKTATEENIHTVENAFAQLPKKIDLIKDFEWGNNNSPEKLNEGLTHCFFVTFATEKDRDAYLTHPQHMAFVHIAQPFIDKVVVLDYWVKK